MTLPALTLPLLLLVTAPADDRELVPFVLPWDDASPSVTNVSAWLDRPAGRLGPVVVRDGHLYTGSKRLRLLGVNLCFGANFPRHADAEKVAARLAKFGVNAVRFHHMDNQTAPGGIWAADRKTLDPGQLDKLDYLFAQLKRHGIYADLNLHVSREYPGRPRWPDMPGYFKGVDNFDPKMVDLQKQYARDLLTHVNPYTKTRYADDPAVAVVEINNENALTHEWFGGGLDGMPAEYSDELTRRWNDWLRRRYADDRALRTAWGATSQPLGAEMLRNGLFGRGLEGWNVERIEGAAAEAAVKQGPTRLVVTVPRPASQGWHVQVTHAGLGFRADQPYTLSFRARSDAPRRISVNLMMAHDPWRHLWTTDVRLTSEWQTFRLSARPESGDPLARLTFTNLGASAGTVELADVSLRPGGAFGLDAGEALGKVHWFPKGDFGRRTPEAQRDWVRFLHDVEADYWTGMAGYLKQDLGVKAPLVGTQMGWSPPSVQARLDVIDSHAYWQHPHFPGRAWDMTNWTVNPLPMAGRPDGGTLPNLARVRVAGKPFLCTEYNHSAPNPFDSETAPLIFAYAALQDWDGVFLFAYSHRHDAWDTGSFGSFFDVDQHPTKMATLPAAAAIFLRGDLAASPPRLGLLDHAAETEALRRGGPWSLPEAAGLSRSDAIAGPVAVRLDGSRTTPATPASGRSTGWTWGPSEGARLVLDTPRSRVWVAGGSESRGAAGDLGITTGPTNLGWAVVTATALDGADLKSPGHVLLTLTAQAGNTGRKWTDSSHTSVGRDWGGRPSRVEIVPATLTLPVPAARLRGWSLDERGKRKTPLKVESDGRGASVRLGEGAGSLWYELEIRP